MLKILIFIFLSLAYFSVSAESDLPAGMLLCSKDSDCAAKGADYVCQAQKYACGPASTCGGKVCTNKHQIECRAKGGQWEGDISGRGRLSGCNMPTKDGGKLCKKAEDCESVCTSNGTCHGWKMFKGCGLFRGHSGSICIE